MLEFLQVRIVSPKEEIFQGLAKSVSSVNSLGGFDLLPEHANFVTLIEDQDLVIVDEHNKVLKFHYPLAIIQSSSGHVNVYIDIPGQN